MRRGAAALALFAALVAVVLPVCAAQGNHASMPKAPAMAYAPDAPQGSNDAAACCSEVEASAAIAPSHAGAVKTFVAAQAATPVAYAAAPRAALLSPAQQALSGPPPQSQLSYYARSARIQR